MGSDPFSYGTQCVTLGQPFPSFQLHLLHMAVIEDKTSGEPHILL